jgi:hypothetical protein
MPTAEFNNISVWKANDANYSIGELSTGVNPSLSASEAYSVGLVGSGTISISGTTITGTGTSFLTQLQKNTAIYDGAGVFLCNVSATPTTNTGAVASKALATTYSGEFLYIPYRTIGKKSPMLVRIETLPVSGSSTSKQIFDIVAARLGSSKDEGVTLNDSFFKLTRVSPAGVFDETTGVPESIPLTGRMLNQFGVSGTTVFTSALQLPQFIWLELWPIGPGSVGIADGTRYRLDFPIQLPVKTVRVNQPLAELDGYMTWYNTFVTGGGGGALGS